MTVTLYPRVGTKFPEGSGYAQYPEAEDPSFDAEAWLSILTDASIPVLAYHCAESGVAETSPGSGVLSTWSDLSGNGATGTAVDAPAVVAAGLNGRTIITTDGANDGINVTINPEAPGTLPWCYYIIARMNAGNISADTLIGGTGAQLRLARGGVDNTIVANNGVGSAAQTMTVATWYRLIGMFNNDTTDYIKVGAAVPATGVNLGNADAGGISYGRNDGGGNFFAGSYALIVIASADMIGQIAALDARTVDPTLGYGATVVV